MENPFLQQYSTVIKNKTNSTVLYSEVRDNLRDVIPDDGYGPFYAKQFKTLGYHRFIELANKARASSETPARLFCWMLKHETEIR